ILDEIGRGTSTYDGLAIAWAVLEHICHPDFLSARSLFATHYYELTDLEGKLHGLKNYHVAVEEKGGEVVFLHHIEAGASDRSYGIEVARLAGCDQTLVTRAYEILNLLEKQNAGRRRLKTSGIHEKVQGQTDLFSSSMNFSYQAEVIQHLKKAELNSMTPLDALKFLHELQQMAKKGQSHG
ncbi:MAG: DNA mismatch repair protein MutS, partial [Eubacteriales bacterium]|nr:DNA mismatch repair protein MutS [Eubacteriales bacterium]